VRPIPPQHKEIISKEPRFKKCWICGKMNVEINHTFIWSGRQINELWSYSALCKEHHTGKTGFHSNRETKDLVQWLCLKEVDPIAVELKYSKANWIKLYDYLKFKYVGKPSSQAVPTIPKLKTY